MLTKPADVFDRDAEWADLAEFATSTLPGLRIAIVFGRRRQGKSYLLRRLADACGGLYYLATEQTEAVSVRRFSDAVARWLDLPAGSVAFQGWEAALNSAVDLSARRPQDSAGPTVLVLDEFPYLTHESPSLPSLVQSLYDRLGPGSASDATPLRLILCGSTISVMSDLISGTKALRGRAGLQLRVRPFGYRDARRYWQITSPAVAFKHNALIGGTPGYRELAPDPTVPNDPAKFGNWVIRNLMRPTAPLFDEADRVVHEDPRIRDTAVYGSLMAAIAAGESSPAKIGGLLGRPSSSLTYQLRMLETAGFTTREQDLLLDRRPTITVSDPIVRFHHLAIEPYLADLEAGRALQVWAELEHTLESKVFGPHFEKIATDWVARYALEEAGLRAGSTGRATVVCREHKTSHEIDILSIRRGAHPRTPGAAIAFIGEAKARRRPPAVAELARLEHIRDVLTSGGHDAADATLGLFSLSGFSDDLVSEAGRRPDGVLLVDLNRLYGH